jgi:osmotically-inducible protein OsmY
MTHFEKVKKVAFFLATLPFAFAGGSGFAAAGNAESKASQYAPDNTGRNLRDVKGGPLTPEDQSKNQGDEKLTQQVRQAIVRDHSLSTNGKNIKIITVAGRVTLRGPVSSDPEKASIDATAKQIAGADHVDNQLEVIPAK